MCAHGILTRSVRPPSWFEILMPYPDIEKLYASGGDCPSERTYIRKVLAAVYYPGILEEYPETLNPFSRTSPRIFLAPKPVCEAHTSAKDIAQVYRDDFIELLIREAKIYWFSTRRSKWQARSASS